MADATERHGFTREQIEFLRETLGRPSAQGFDRPMLMWLIGGLVGLGVAAFGIMWAEVGSVRTELRAEIGSVRTELGEQIKENRAAIADLAAGIARIEAILEERLPRDV